MTVDQNWLKFMREQYPQGSRIRLREMKDPYNPVEPGTMGTLIFIDDLGSIHCNWDNGRTLGLVMGEDSFSVLSPEPTLLKLYMPMTVTCYECNDYGNLENEEVTMDSRKATTYADTIAGAILRERRPEEAERGLMKYYGEHDGVERKVRSVQFVAETRDGKLWGVAECKVIGELTPDELDILKDYVSGQASDGVGECFEQHAIKFGEVEMYAHLWNSNNSWSIQTEQELFSAVFGCNVPGADPKVYEQAPQMGGMTLG